MVFKKCWRFRFPLSDNQRLIISPHAKGSRYCLRRIDWPQETGILAMVIKNQRLMSMFLCAKCSSSIVEIVMNQSRSGNGFGGIHQLRRIR